MNEKEKLFPINIWDDFEDKNGNTYATVENYDLDDSKCKQLLEMVICMLDSCEKDFEYTLVYHDSENDYDKETVDRCKKDYGVDFFYKQWQINFSNMTHKKLEKLLKTLKHEDSIFEFYSES